MENTILIQHCLQLSKSDWRQVDLYVNADCFNLKPALCKAFAYLRHEFKKANPKPTREGLFARTFPGQRYSDTKLRHVMSDLTRIIHEFYIHQELEKEVGRRELLLVRALRKRGLEKAYHQYWNKSQTMLDKAAYKPSKQYLLRYQLLQEQYEFIRIKARSGQMKFQEMYNALSIFFIAETLRQACNITSYQSIRMEEFQIPLLPEILLRANQGIYADQPAIQLYYQCYLALSNAEDPYPFDQLKAILNSHLHLLPPSEARDLMLLIINYCIRKVNQGQPDFAAEGLDLYIRGIEQGILLENNSLSRFTYNNVLMLALVLKRYSWAENFLEKYKFFLKKEERKNIFSYNLAILHFRKLDYSKAMELLLHTDLKDVQYHLNARRMLLKIYYEQAEFQALESLLDSFRIYLLRHKDLGYHKNLYLQLIRFVDKLTKQNLNEPKIRQKLRQELESTRALLERDWLLKQLQ